MSFIEEAIKRKRAAVAAGDARKGTAPAPREDAKPYLRNTLGDPSRLRSLNVDFLRAEGLLPPESEARRIEHQFRTLKRPLIRSMFSEGEAAVHVDSRRLQRSVMVSSALPGDGKTFTSLNLALSMAMEKDHTVILVDGDVAKPHISGLFQAAEDRGLLNVLDDPRESIASVLIPTDVPGLSVVPVGRQSRHATELLASARMREVIFELQALDSRGIVLVDSPPILLTSEARVLAALFQHVVLVVRAGGTPQQAVKDAIEYVGEGPTVSLVLNEALHASEAGYYGYGGQYGSGAAVSGEAGR